MQSKALWNTIQRFKGPWLLSPWHSDSDPSWLRLGESDSSDSSKLSRNAIVMCSNDFLARFEYEEEDVIGEDCKFLQREVGGKVNEMANGKLTKR